MSLFIDWLNSPIGAIAWLAVAAICIGVVRWAGGPDVWSHFLRGLREGWDFYVAAITPWTWPRRVRAWRTQQH